MIVYQTDYDGFYQCETVADIDPLDPSNFLIPAGCVTQPPPSVSDGFVAQLVDGSWIVVEEPVIEEEVEETDPLSEEDYIRFERDMRLGWCDWTMMPDTDDAHREAWIAYRQALRDLTSQPGFPDNVVWPKQPYKTPLSVERNLTWEE